MSEIHWHFGERYNIRLKHDKKHSLCHTCHQHVNHYYIARHRAILCKSKVPSSLSSLSDDRGGSGAWAFDGGGPQGQPPFIKQRKGIWFDSCIDKTITRIKWKAWQELKQSRAKWCSPSCHNVCAVLTWQESFGACGGGSVASMLQSRKKRTGFYNDDEYLWQEPASDSILNQLPPRKLYSCLIWFCLRSKLEIISLGLKMHYTNLCHWNENWDFF